MTPKALAILRPKVKAAFFHERHDAYGLSYQSCRFCKVSAYETRYYGLWKYEVRHYICTDCRNNVLAGRSPRRPTA